jgi:DNA-binding HxlR family transcriptional regulator
VDRQTASLIDVLRHPGATFLARLLEGPATEAELMEDVTGATQPTGNRRLARMERAGLIEREGDGWRAPGRRWAVVHPQEVDAVIAAAADLADAVAERERRQRAAMRQRQRRARARRLGVHQVRQDA